MDLEMLFFRIGYLRKDNWVKSTDLFLVFLASVLAYLVFIRTTSIHFSIGLLVVFKVQYSTVITSLIPVLMHLPHSAGIHLPYSAAVFSLPTHRFDYLFFAMLLFHAAISTHLPFSSSSPINFPICFHSSLNTGTSISQHMSPKTPLAITPRFHIICSHLNLYRYLALTVTFHKIRAACSR